MFKQYEMELGGRKLVLEFGKYAEQAEKYPRGKW